MRQLRCGLQSDVDFVRAQLISKLKEIFRFCVSWVQRDGSFQLDINRIANLI